MTREQAEQRALEYANKYVESIAPSDPNFDYAELAEEHHASRIAYIKCWEDMNEQQEQLREAAEKVVDYALYGGLGVNLHDAIVELEKSLK